MWTKWLRVIAFFLAGELGFFVLVKLIFHATWSALVGPYLAFAVTFMSAMVFFGSFNAWCDRGNLSPRSVALICSFGAAIWVSLIDCAWAYLALNIGLLSGSFLNDWSNWGIPVGLTALCFPFLMYRAVYRNALARRTLKDSASHA